MSDQSPSCVIISRVQLIVYNFFHNYQNYLFIFVQIKFSYVCVCVKHIGYSNSEKIKLNRLCVYANENISVNMEIKIISFDSIIQLLNYYFLYDFSPFFSITLKV